MFKKHLILTTKINKQKIYYFTTTYKYDHVHAAYLKALSDNMIFPHNSLRFNQAGFEIKLYPITYNSVIFLMILPNTNHKES